MMICEKCNVEMEKQPYQHPWVTQVNAIVFQNIKADVYICPCCGKELDVLPNDEDGYSAGAGLFSED